MSTWWLLVSAFVVSACDVRHHAVGDSCTYRDGAGNVFTEECDSGLYCSVQTEHCTLPHGAGDTCKLGCDLGTASCDFPCEDGLLCGPGNVCTAPAPEGSVCATTAECQTGLVCNHGYLPGDVKHGECRPPGGVGQPCGYSQYRASAQVQFQGCLGTLTCVPPDVTAATIVANAADHLCTAAGPDPDCGFAGVCQAFSSVPEGGACLDTTACANHGTCNALGLPYSSTTSASFLCAGGTSSGCWVGPWPGLCGPSPTAQVGATDGQACSARTCAPGYLCGDSGTCKPRWHGTPGAPCGAFGTGAPLDDYCEIGLECTGTPAECT